METSTTATVERGVRFISDQPSFAPFSSGTVRGRRRETIKKHLGAATSQFVAEIADSRSGVRLLSCSRIPISERCASRNERELLEVDA